MSLRAAGLAAGRSLSTARRRRHDPRMPMPILSLPWARCVLFSSVLAGLAAMPSLRAQSTPPVVAAPADTTGAAAAGKPSILRRVDHGRVEQHGDLVLVRTWGTPEQRGRAHGLLMANEVAAAIVQEFSARYGNSPKILDYARRSLPRMIEFPEFVQQEIDGLWQGLVDSKVELKVDGLGRAFDRTDLMIVNALDVFGLLGCSGFTVWGEQVLGGGVLTARNFDWPLTGPHLLQHTVLVVQHDENGRASASVGWPGYVGTVTGVSSDGVATFLHTGSAEISIVPQPQSWPSAAALRSILRSGTHGGDAAKVFAFARQELENTSPPIGYLTHVVLPFVPANGAPLGVFETDVKTCVQGEVGAGPFVLTNHFRTRKDGRDAGSDSENRERQLGAGLGKCLATGDKVTSVAEAWDALHLVDRGGRSFGTLHSLVFRHEPWCFELRIAEPGEKGLVAAPVSTRRYALSRQQVFAEGELLGK